MATQDLRAAYNAPSTRQAIARAIRVEIPEGDAILKAEQRAYQRLRRRSLLTDDGRPSEAALALAEARARRVEAEKIVRQRWGMPPITGQAE